VREVAAEDPASIAGAVADAALVLSAAGPFARTATTVVDACLGAGVPYVDIANEWVAVRAVLDRDAQAREHGVALVTGAGFGPAMTETLVLRLIEQAGAHPAPIRVRVASAAAVARRSEGVRRTIEDSLPQGALTYRDGRIVREALGTGATMLQFGGMVRQMMPAPVGDLETARLASAAPESLAFIPLPGSTSESPTAHPDSAEDTMSYAWAEITWAHGRSTSAELRTGEGVAATAAIAAETARRVLAGAEPGAWTPGRLFGPALAADATGADITLNPVAA
jgi:short subunit dehydrogenase-like uncharacterized protein